MAELVTSDNQQFYFDPSAISAVADHDADTERAVTTVYGLAAGRLRIRESVAAFLNRVGVEKRFARLTRLDDTFIWVNCAALAVIQSPLPGEYPDAAKTLFSLGPFPQAVKETLVEVRALVNARGGRI